MRLVLPLLASLAILILTGCTTTRTPGDWADVEDLTPGFLVGTYGADASVTGDSHGRVALTWVTRDSAGATDLWSSVSLDSGATFSPPERVNARPGKVASYPESRPVAAFGPSGRLLLVWASLRDSSEMASDIVARVTREGGRTLGPEHAINDEAGDPRSPYHGFAAADWLADGRAVVAWIDGRATRLAAGEEEPHTAEVFMDLSADGGESWGLDTRVAALVCPCCRIALRTHGDADLALAYRGAGADLRDPRLAFSRDSGRSWRADSLVSRDGWKLDGCPSIGPTLIVDGGALGGHFAWFTGADSIAGVRTLEWHAVGDSAVALGSPTLHADSLREPTRPMLASLAGGVLLGVLARPIGEDAPRVLALRPLGDSQHKRDWVQLGAGVRSAALAAAGGGAAWATWTEDTGEGPRVRLARLRLRS